ncbi:MAG: Unknown protein [uncultured Sulfurovum sp.]|uniref:LPS export ABC transporter periplasmic protein LptC n=1 Tax=uncultured Sulfurovum sp. TaxID=269237 RepID=A0A6S6U064_9BACT|nr:MAG: Unknown protein [uncultured Sulfurovum sp.]
MRLEVILIVFIAITIGATTMIKLEDTTISNSPLHKEVEFYDTTFVEVNETKLLAKLYSNYGVQKAGVLTLDNVAYTTENIQLLLADKGTYKGDILYLDGNVSLKDFDGYVYRTEHANYDQTSEILNITSSFIAHMDQNIFKGNSLEYHTSKKEANASRVEAVFYTTDK